MNVAACPRLEFLQALNENNLHLPDGNLLQHNAR